MKPARSILSQFLFVMIMAFPGLNSNISAQTNRADQALADYFRAETKKLSNRCLADITTLPDWTSRREKYREQLLEMLGLWPLREKTDLKPVVTGKIERDDFTVEKIYFQSSPGLYVTANLYLPKNLKKTAPTILYVCGHSPVVTNGVSYGTKAAYQHHGIWFARNGYVCMVIDTLESGEIRGTHHGTYNENMWWWNSRGYTPAGVETWNNIRAIDYLSTRPEVDTNRFGVTGRSGGGAYSWYLAAVDDRIQCAAPVAGITDLQNHVVDGTVEGHCDCMFMVNTYRWDYPQVAAMVAPRPLLIANSDKDTIFPLDGVQRLHAKVRKIYDLYKSGDKLGLLITEGPHKDTQDLQLPVFRWFNRQLKGEDPVIEMAAVKMFTPQELKVFDKLPDDQINTKIHETFVPKFHQPPVPKTQVDWAKLRDGWMRDLKEKVFAGWPEESGPLDVTSVSRTEERGAAHSVYEFSSDRWTRLTLKIDQPEKKGPLEDAILFVAGLGDAPSGAHGDSNLQSQVFVHFAPRGTGSADWKVTEKKRIQLRRRFMLLGQTEDGMRVWDIRRALAALRSLPFMAKVKVTLSGDGPALFAAVVDGVDLNWQSDFSTFDVERNSRANLQPDFLNVLKYLDAAQAITLVAERSKVPAANKP